MMCNNSPNIADKKRLIKGRMVTQYDLLGFAAPDKM